MEKDTKPRHGRGRKVLTVALIAAAFLVSMASLRSCVNSHLGERRGELAARIEGATSLRAAFGELAWRFPHGVGIDNLELRDRSGLLVVTAKRVTAWINPLGLLRRQGPAEAVSSLEVEGAEVTIRRPGKAIGPLVAKGPSAEGKKAPEGLPRRIVVRGADVVVDTGKDRAVAHFGKAELISGGGKRTLTLEAGGGRCRLTIPGEGERVFTVSASSFPLTILTALFGDILPFSSLSADADGRIEETAPTAWSFGGRLALRSEGVVLANLEARGDSDGRGEGTAAGRLVVGGEVVDFRLVREPPPRDIVGVEARFPRFSFPRAAAAIPPALRPNLPDLAVTGYLEGTFRASFRTRTPHRARHDFRGKVEPPRVLSLGPRVRPERLLYPFTHTVVTPSGRTFTFRVGPENPDFVPLEDIPPSLVKAVITAEDGGFFHHRGVNVGQVVEALAENLAAGRVVRGASTISMQLAKNLYLGRERTMGRKIEEFFITLALEERLSKGRIMEIYLNVIEWGDGIYGIGPAARHYFQKHPRDLDDLECAFLASIIARPTAGWKPNPLVEIGDGWWGYLDVILEKMQRRELPPNWRDTGVTRDGSNGG